MKKVSKNDLHLEKEVISRLSQDDLTTVRGGIGYKLQTQLNVDCFRPTSYDGNCKTVTGAATCNLSCKGECPIQSVYVACKLTDNGCVESEYCQTGQSNCFCALP